MGVLNIFPIYNIINTLRQKYFTKIFTQNIFFIFRENLMNYLFALLSV